MASIFASQATKTDRSKHSSWNLFRRNMTKPVSDDAASTTDTHSNTSLPDQSLFSSSVTLTTEDRVVLVLGTPQSEKSAALRALVRAHSASTGQRRPDTDSHETNGATSILLAEDEQTYRFLDPAPGADLDSLDGAAMAILFVVDIAAYDQPRVSNSNDGNNADAHNNDNDNTIDSGSSGGGSNSSSSSRLEDDIALFDTVCNSPKFSTTAVLLLFTNFEEFKSKLVYAPFERFFPVQLHNFDHAAGFDYILRRFAGGLGSGAEEGEGEGARRQVYAHFADEIGATEVQFVRSGLEYAGRVG